MKLCVCCGEERPDDMFPLNVGRVAELGVQDFCLTCLDDLDAMDELDGMAVAEPSPVVVAEVTVTRSLSWWDRRRCEGYLAHRWGVRRQLPWWHPFRWIRPRRWAV